MGRTAACECLRAPARRRRPHLRRPGGQLGLLDAYLDIPVGGDISARVGQFRAHVSREALIDSGNLFFVERSAIGNHFSGRSQGIALSGDMGEFDIALTIQNGNDGTGDELFMALRGGIDLMGAPLRSPSQAPPSLTTTGPNSTRTSRPSPPA